MLNFYNPGAQFFCMHYKEFWLLLWPECQNHCLCIVCRLFLFFSDYKLFPFGWILNFKERAISELSALTFACGVQGQIGLNYNLSPIFFLFLLLVFFFFKLAIGPCCTCGSPVSSKCGGNTANWKKKNLGGQGRCLYLSCSTPFP